MNFSYQCSIHIFTVSIEEKQSFRGAKVELVVYQKHRVH
jgi:hypothetical protein